MSEVIQSLNENLKRQVTLYEEVLTLEGHKQKALIQNNLKEIESITVQEERLLLDAGRLEKERLLWAEQIGRELGKAPEELTLAELAEYFPVLQEVCRDLDQVIGRLQEVHGTNTQLLQQAMRIVEFTVEMFTHQQRNTYTYPNRKENPENRKLHLLDWKV